MRKDQFSIQKKVLYHDFQNASSYYRWQSDPIQNYYPKKTYTEDLKEVGKKVSKFLDVNENNNTRQLILKEIDELKAQHISLLQTDILYLLKNNKFFDLIDIEKRIQFLFHKDAKNYDIIQMFYEKSVYSKKLKEIGKSSINNKNL